MKTFFKELLKEGGTISSMRFTLVSGIIMIAFLVAIIGYIVFFKADINYIDKIVFAIGTVAGIFITGKVFQKFAEVKENKSTTIETNIDNSKTADNENKN